MISVKDISKKIRESSILENINFEVKNGEILGLVGPNGAGKTTLLNIIGGIWLPDAGDVVLDGESILAGSGDLKKKLGYIADVPFLYPKLTGREFLSFVGCLYKIEEKILEKKILELEKALELSYWLDELMEGYPRGVRQKMTYAAMLLHSPKILLLDEPLTNLDPKSSRLVKDLLRRLAAEGASILLSTHILEIAERFCNRIVVIHRGKKIAEGNLQQLQDEAKSPGSNLEDLFLQLTGGEKYTELLNYIS